MPWTPAPAPFARLAEELARDRARRRYRHTTDAVAYALRVRTTAGNRRRRLVAAGAGLLAAAGAVGVVGPAPAGAAVFDVTVTTDGGAGSLRDAFAQASVAGEASEIVLQAGATYVLDDCVEGDLDYTGSDPLTITGNGATIQQTCDERVIETDGDIIVTDTRVTGGNQAGGLGGGIEADTDDITLIRSTVAGNQSSTGGGVAAIRVTLVASTVSGNTASSTGGGIWVDQTLDATNSTITGNSAGTSGGGVAVVNTSITLLYVTVVGNTAPIGANLQLQDGSDALISAASVIGDPLGGGADCDVDDGAVTTSQGYNFSSDASCGFGAGPGDRSAAGDPGVGALAANGGPTPTMLPGPASPLLDGVDCAATPVVVTSDQRGITRPQGPACDIGAVEVVVAVPLGPSFTG
jgi:hypothetical protein